MLRPRIIPCLLVQNGGLVKTTRFSKPKYVGDPINAVRIFNEKEVDELMVLDIDATVQGREPDYTMIDHLAAECRMPLCYGGGVRTPEQVEQIVSLGVEKVAISSAAYDVPDLLAESAARVGRQSMVVVLDVKKSGFRQRYELFTHNGAKGRKMSPFDFAREIEKSGAGEIIVNSIDRDGTMQGYDLALAKQIRASIEIPMSMIGGAGDLDHLLELFRYCGTVGAGAGSMFVFKGKYRAVLIQYPDEKAREKIYSDLENPTLQSR